MIGRLSRTIYGSAIAVGLLSAQIGIPEVTLSAGGGATLPLSFEAPDFITALQFDIEYDSSALQIEVIVGDAIRDSAKQLFCLNIQGGKRFVIGGMNSGRIAQGTLLQLHLRTARTSTAGSYPIRLLNLTAASADGDEVWLGSTDGRVNVELHAGEALPAISIMNAASFLAGPVAAGELITIIGTGLSPDDPDLPHIRCVFDGVAAPILFLQANRFSTIISDTVRGKSDTVLELRHDSQTIASATLPVSRAAPGVFTLQSTGVGQAVAMNQDGSLNSAANPAPRDSLLNLFVTGTDSIGSVSVRSGTVNWEVLSVSPAVDLEGVTTVVARVPSEMEPGVEVGLVIESQGSVSQPGVTVAIR
jgi:uncharacterized protein (TIGR03437 family)